jgi:hypothetical protein
MCWCSAWPNSKPPFVNISITTTPIRKALIALAVGLGDRALTGFQEGMAEAFSAH